MVIFHSYVQVLEGFFLFQATSLGPQLVRLPGVDSLAEGLVVLAESTTTGLSAVDDQLIKADSWCPLGPWLWWDKQEALNIKNHQRLGFPVVFFPKKKEFRNGLAEKLENRPSQDPPINNFLSQKILPKVHFSRGPCRDEGTELDTWISEQLIFSLRS